MHGIEEIEVRPSSSLEEYELMLDYLYKGDDLFLRGMGVDRLKLPQRMFLSKFSRANGRNGSRCELSGNSSATAAAIALPSQRNIKRRGGFFHKRSAVLVTYANNQKLPRNKVAVLWL
jgi:hypothetical protein